jgi:hypothetical protein
VYELKLLLSEALIFRIVHLSTASPVDTATRISPPSFLRYGGGGGAGSGAEILFSPSCARDFAIISNLENALTTAWGALAHVTRSSTTCWPGVERCHGISRSTSQRPKEPFRGSATLNTCRPLARNRHAPGTYLPGLFVKCKEANAPRRRGAPSQNSSPVTLAGNGDTSKNENVRRSWRPCRSSSVSICAFVPVKQVN